MKENRTFVLNSIFIFILIVYWYNNITFINTDDGFVYYEF